MLFVGIQGLAQRLQYAPPVPVWPLRKRSVKRSVTKLILTSQKNSDELTSVGVVSPFFDITWVLFDTIIIS